jgi:hypothetical protein
VGAALPDELHPVAVAVLEGEGDPLLHPSLPVLGGNLEDADAEVDGSSTASTIYSSVKPFASIGKSCTRDMQ